MPINLNQQNCIPMIRNFKMLCTLLLSVSVVNSCTGNHANNANMPSAECIKLNNAGFDSLINYPMNSEKGLDHAIDLLKLAIKCDSTYPNPYINLVNAYDQKGNYNEEMINLNKVLLLTNNDPSFLTIKGMLFERMKNIDSAKKTYSLAQKRFTNILVKQPKDINAIEGIVRLKGITDGKDSAIKELDEQIKKNPDLSSKLFIEYEFYEHFDRENYIMGSSANTSATGLRVHGNALKPVK